MNKSIPALLAALVLGGALASPSAAAKVPFSGTDLLTVTEAGKPAAGVSIDLYRVNLCGGADTFLGTFRTDEQGAVVAGHLTTGLYRWSSEDTQDTLFRISKAGVARTAIELPAAASDELPAIAEEETPAPVPASIDLPAEEPEDGREQMTYMSGDGFQLRYNALTVESRELDDHAAEFVYLGEADGADKVTVRWIEGKQPEEALYETTFAWGDQETIRRSEGLFPGTDDKWGYWRTFSDGDLVKCAIAGEYNGGVLMFEIETLLTGDEGTDMTVSDTLAEIIDSVTYFDFGEQTMYSYIPGVYESKTEEGAAYQVTLRADHTGTLSFQDSVDVLWGSIELTAPEGTYSYTVEGDFLYLDLDGVWVEFERQQAE